MRFYTVRLAATLVTVCLCAPAIRAQAVPELSRQQRELLGALITAVDRLSAEARSAKVDAANLTPRAEHEWSLHVLRASDGSHYVAASVIPPAASLPGGPVVLYVRLATATKPGEATLAERSIVREWLQGSRVDPRMLPRRGMAIGEMPPMGAGAIGVRGGPSVGSADLQTLDLQRERARQRKEEEEKKRIAGLEGSTALATDRLPFEDFEIGAAASFSDGTRAIQRALTAGPGAYDLYLAWADAAQPAGRAQIHVARRSLQLAPAVTGEFGLSSVIVAERVAVRQVPYSAIEQRAHPFVIGLTEIVPARDTSYTPAESLAFAFQIINPYPSPDGKPDVRVDMRLVRQVGARDEPVAALSPLSYTANTVPADFDLRLGHPLIAAAGVPLATVPRGAYRLMITAEDRLGGALAAADARFTVIGTPVSLLAEAPAVAPRFDRGAALAPAVMMPLLDQLSPAMPSPALARPLQSARAGRFGDLLVEDAVPANERAVRVALSGLALLSLGDSGAAAQFERALQGQVKPGPVLYLLGVARAQQNRDAEAIAQWRGARESGFTSPVIDRLIAEAHLRRREYDLAADAVRAGDDPASVRTFAATRIATGKHADAISALDGLLAAQPDDFEGRWLLLHALYADLVGGNRGRAERVVAEANRYLEAKGPNAALAAEWRRAATSF